MNSLRYKKKDPEGSPQRRGRESVSERAHSLELEEGNRERLN